MRKIVSTKKISTIFFAIILFVGIIGLTSPYTAYGMAYQSAKCDDTNVNINGIDQTQLQQQTENNNFDAAATDGQQLTPEEETLNALNSNDESLLNFEKNNVNLCFNTNDNFVDAEFVGTQEQLPPPPPPSCEVTVDTITGFGTKVLGLAYDDDHDRMYVTNQLDGTVSVIDTATNTIINTIEVGGFPTGIAYDGENQMYVALQNFPGTVSVIDTTTNTIIDTNPATPAIDPINVGSGPFFIAYDDDRNRMYVANDFGFPGTVSVIDAATNTVIDTIENLPGAPMGIAYDTNNERIYVTHFFDGTVSVIDTNTNTVIDTNPATTAIDPIRVGVFPEVITYDDDHNRMYVANFGDDTVSVIDTNTNTVIDTITVGNAPEGIAYNTDNQRIYVTNHDDGTVSVIDTTTTPNTVIDTITVGPSPLGIAHDTDKNRMYVANSGASTVSVINLC